MTKLDIATESVEKLETESIAPSGAANPRRVTRGRLTFRRFLRNRTALVGVCVIVLLVFLAVFGPILSPWGYAEVDPKAFLKPPSARHFLGTTQAGRDVLALVMRGMGKSLIIGFSVAILSTSIAAIVGSFAAY
ncbi:MAG: ABC transporter permease, partial [Propionibacteriaceae bacterium]